MEFNFIVSFTYSAEREVERTAIPNESKFVTEKTCEKHTAAED